MKLIFDIGYNRGKFTKECFATYPFCRVVALEANRCLIDPDWSRTTEEGRAHWHADAGFMTDAFATLSHNKATGDLTIVYGLGSASSDKPGVLYMCPTSPGISTASDLWRGASRFALGSANINRLSNWNHAAAVPSVTLDELISRYGSPDLIKIDVEGYELELLRGLTTKQKTICFEWTEELPEVLYQGVKHLQELGYNEFGIIGYFVEGQYSETITHNEAGDPFLVEPDNYYAWEEIEIDSVIDSSRRINYGMLFAR
tara:strand:+ start:174 stop:947 length:774 start_codon:yes stop_codon:yes gene_type:complete